MLPTREISCNQLDVGIDWFDLIRGFGSSLGTLSMPVLLEVGQRDVVRVCTCVSSTCAGACRNACACVYTCVYTCACASTSSPGASVVAPVLAPVPASILSPVFVPMPVSSVPVTCHLFARNSHTPACKTLCVNAFQASGIKLPRSAILIYSIWNAQNDPRKK